MSSKVIGLESTTSTSARKK